MKVYREINVKVYFFISICIVLALAMFVASCNGGSTIIGNKLVVASKTLNSYDFKYSYEVRYNNPHIFETFTFLSNISYEVGDTLTIEK